MSEPGAPQREDSANGFRLDVLIAVCALLISSLAAAASWWQSRIVATQLSSQVWPYVSISQTIGPKALEVDVSNDGVGPAIMRSVVLTVDGKPHATFVEAMHSLLPAGPPAHGSFSSIGIGSVIKVGGSVTLLRVENLPFIRALLPQSNRIDLRLCYCSILGDCWSRGMRGDTEPVRTRACPVDGSSHYLGYGRSL
ncbi:MAG: hypothetical protein JO083_02700 [Candidatus Eremiobacteraeota bacterium]|nr:hypothetical protein [Candidatus Eremiobacteraeota bacterium]